jgi:ABC-2 type transport system ATP-binding protein
MAEPIARLTGVSRVFRSLLGRRKVWAVRGLTLEVRPGEIFGLLGPNGSGKTTTLQMLLGLLTPTEGTIEVFGRQPRDRECRRRIGYLPEEFEAGPFLTGEETLRFYGGFHGLGRKEVRRRAEQLLRDLGLWDHRLRRVRDYSKGMRRRIGLAQSLLHDPDLLVLDEPTNGLDPLGIQTFKSLLRARKHGGRSIVVSSHSLSEMEDICDRVAILNQGRPLVMGPLGDLLTVPGRHRLEVEGPLPPRETLSSALQGLGLGLSGVEPSRAKLEELFLRVVSEESRKSEAGSHREPLRPSSGPSAQSLKPKA